MRVIKYDVVCCRPMFNVFVFQMWFFLNSQLYANCHENMRCGVIIFFIRKSADKTNEQTKQEKQTDRNMQWEKKMCFWSHKGFLKQTNRNTAVCIYLFNHFINLHNGKTQGRWVTSGLMSNDSRGQSSALESPRPVSYKSTKQNKKILVEW